MIEYTPDFSNLKVIPLKGPVTVTVIPTPWSVMDEYDEEFPNDGETPYTHTQRLKKARTEFLEHYTKEREHLFSKVQSRVHTFSIPSIRKPNATL